MTRLVLLTLFNLALPFLIRAAWLLALRIYRKRQKERGIIDVTPVRWHFPYLKLLAIGLLLLAVSLFAWRLHAPDDAPFESFNVRNGPVDS